MNHLMDRLAAAGEQPLTDTSEDVVAADLRRARATLARRRTRVGTTGLAVLAIAGVGVAGAAGAFSSGRSPSHAAQPARTARTAAPGSSTTAAANDIALVAYHGKQPAGFSVASIPQGYVMQHSDSELLEIAASTNHSSANTFVHKLLVTLMSRDESLSQAAKGATPVQVGGHQGYYSDQGVASVLTYTDGSHVVQIQCWNNVGLTQSQLVQFASGVTVRGNPTAPRG